MSKRPPSTFIQPHLLEDYLIYCQHREELGDVAVSLSIHQITSLITAYLELLHKEKSPAQGTEEE